jgi:hypothetical protein
MTIRIGANNFVQRTSGWLLVGSCLLVGLAMTLLYSPAALAQGNPCTSNYIPIPTCELQAQAPVHYEGWQTTNTAYYCTGDHPYFYGLNQSYIFSYVWDNPCFSVSENMYLDDVNKLDVLVTNWCITAQNLDLTLACSATPQPGTAFCATQGGPVSDPGCPQGASKTYCSRGGTVPVCFQLYKETCSNNVSYQCQIMFGISSCLQCKGTGDDRSKASKILSIPSLNRSVE